MAGQTRRLSAVEAVTNVSVGYGLALVTQALVFPLFGIEASAGEHVAIALVFTVVSLLRSYALRRAFNWWGEPMKRRKADLLDLIEWRPIRDQIKAYGRVFAVGEEPDCMAIGRSENDAIRANAARAAAAMDRLADIPSDTNGE